VTVASSRVFVDGALEGRVAIVTGGGTNLGQGGRGGAGSLWRLRRDRG
jgi:hypothetical protein